MNQPTPAGPAAERAGETRHPVRAAAGPERRAEDRTGRSEEEVRDTVPEGRAADLRRDADSADAATDSADAATTDGADGAMAGPTPPVEPGPGESGPAPLGVAWDRTGHPEVDSALERLAALDDLGTERHRAAYENVHQDLRTVLDGLDRPDPAGSGTGPSTPPPSDPRS